MTTRNNAPLTFSNNAQKQYYGRRGPFRVFGEDVDQREAFSDQKAAERFETVWNSRLGRAVGEADVILPEAAADKLPGNFRAFFDNQAEHREFRLDGCTFIAQLKGTVVNQLWFIPSTSGDPRTIYVRFESVDAKERFERAARSIDRNPETLALKLLTDFTDLLLGDPEHSVQRDNR